jgi:quercetin dioxygenase-like cupin family protein
MTNMTRLLLAGAILVAGMSMTVAPVQTAEKEPAAGKPVIFDDGIRARDRLAPTPQYAALASGLYARQVVQTASERGDYTVEIWSLTVSPHASTGEARLPGAAVVILYAGRVELIIGDQKTRLQPGASASVPEGASVRFVNGDDNRPAQLRAIVLSGSR